MRNTLTVRQQQSGPGGPQCRDGERPGVDREAELRTLMIMASHDLKNPLTSVAAHVAMLRDDHHALDGDFLTTVAAIERGLHRMRRLTQDLLDYARADRALNLAPFSLDSLVREIVADHLAAATTARMAVKGGLPAVVADAGLVRHVVDNLIGNAVTYTRAGAIPEVEIRASTTPGGGAVRVEVADRGIGVPAGEQARIFDAFHRAANTVGHAGTGLGLHICRHVIDRHGGRIGVEDNPGGGSCFWFTLPLGVNGNTLAACGAHETLG